VVERLAHGHDRHGQRWHLHLPREEESLAQVRPLILLLGLPTFGLSLAISVLTTYGPVVLLRLTHSPTAVGALIGVEGALALVIPLAAGEISDRLPPSPLGRRLPFVLVGAPLAATALALLPFSSATAIAGAWVLIFFVGYYIYYPPYRALYADLLPRALYARASGPGDRPRPPERPFLFGAADASPSERWSPWGRAAVTNDRERWGVALSPFCDVVRFQRADHRRTIDVSRERLEGWGYPVTDSIGCSPAAGWVRSIWRRRSSSAARLLSSCSPGTFLRTSGSASAS
jgi:hypothetical protein